MSAGSRFVLPPAASKPIHKQARGENERNSDTPTSVEECFGWFASTPGPGHPSDAHAQPEAKRDTKAAGPASYEAHRTPPLASGHNHGTIA
jgi:hypothetical protein